MIHFNKFSAICSSLLLGILFDPSATAVAGTLSLQARLRPDGAQQSFATFDIDGDTAVAPLPATSGDGNVYVFVRTNGLWSKQATLGPRVSSSTFNTFQPGAVAVSGNTIAVLWFTFSGPLEHVAIYVRSGTTWTLQKVLMNDGFYLGPSNGGQSGARVALDGDTLAIATLQNLVHVFVRAVAAWTEQALVRAPNVQQNDSFGDSIALKGNTLVVGEPNHFSEQGTKYRAEQGDGAAYIFSRQAGAWHQDALLIAPRGDVRFFGGSVAVSADSVLVAGDSNIPTNPAGLAAYLYQRNGAAWAAQGKLIVAGSSSTLDHLTRGGITIDGDTAAVGAYHGNNQAAPGFYDASVFVRSGTVWSQDQVIPVTPSGNGPVKYTRRTLGVIAITGPGDYAHLAVYIDSRPPAPTLTVSPSVLFFGAAQNGSVITPRQTLTVTVSSTPPGLAWTAAADQNWLTLSTTGGSGTGTLAPGIQAGTYTPGTLQGNVIVSAPGVTPVTIPVTLTTYAAASAPRGTIDTPLQNTSNVTGSIPVTGWATDDVGVTRVRLFRDPVQGEPAGVQLFIGDAVFVAGARPDITAAYPTSPASDSAGWGYLLLTNFLPNRGNGTVTLYAYADDLDGHTTLLGARTITCTNATATLPFGAIDTPRQGETVSGSVNNFGWVLSRGSSRADVPGGGTVTVLIDGTVIGVPSGWTSRSDLSTLFPAAEYSGVSSALAVHTFDSTAFANGLHTIAWIVFDNQGAGDGVGSRYFTIANGSAGATSAASVFSSSVPARLGAVATTPVEGRRGFDLQAPFQPYRTDPEGVVTVQAEELDRIELRLTATAGSLRTVRGMQALPVGARIDPVDGVFTWQPGVAFVGTYDFAFDTPDGQRNVRIVLNPKNSGRVGTQVVIDTPRMQQDVGQPFTIAGWAADLAADSRTGIDAIHVWAYPLAGGDPIFVGIATLDGQRPDVAAIYGQRVRDSGYGLAVSGLTPGNYDLAVFAWSSVHNGFVPATTVRVTVR